MTYCTHEDLIDRYGEEELIQLTDRDGIGVIDARRLDAAIEAATAIIDSRLGVRYTLPIRPVPLILERLAVKLTWLTLMDDAQQLDDGLRKDRETLLGELDAIAAGRIGIGIDAAGARPESHGTATIISGGNVFNRRDKSFI